MIKIFLLGGGLALLLFCHPPLPGCGGSAGDHSGQAGGWAGEGPFTDGWKGQEGHALLYQGQVS